MRGRAIGLVPAAAAVDPGAVPSIRPNWFTSVMGTGIVALVASALTIRIPGTEAIAIAAWLLAGSGLLVLLALAGPALREHGISRFADDPHTAPFLGAPPMAACTVAAATAVAGRHVLGLGAALDVAALLWVPATVAGCACAVALPLRAARRPALRVDPGHPTWILAAVPPLTAATTGTVFAAHLPAGGVRSTFLAVLGVLLLAGLLGAVAAIRLVLVRMRRIGLGPVRSVPTLWIVLGPLGQTMAAVLLIAAADGGRGGPAAAVAAAFAAVAVGWLAFVLVVTLAAARRGLPFSLAWWSFTFPVGTVALGAAELGRTTGAAGPAWAAVLLFALLLAGWALAVQGTVRTAWRDAGAARGSARDRIPVTS
jgi:tellurite resistance protein TehA-like permease